MVVLISGPNDVMGGTQNCLVVTVVKADVHDR
jgi:hypothetical protein